MLYMVYGTFMIDTEKEKLQKEIKTIKNKKERSKLK